MEFIEKQAFRGIRALYGDEGLARLQQASVMVIGVGGIGSWCTEALCRSGVGSLSLIDPDVIEITNLNRQLHTLSTTCGQYKAEILGQRLLQINPHLNLKIDTSLLTVENIASKLEGCPDYICECIDDLKAKAAIVDYLYKHHKTFIVAGGAGGRIDPQALHLGDLAQAQGDALISKLRQELRRNYGYPKGGKKMQIMCTYSSETPIYAPKEGYLQGDLPTFGASMTVTACAGLNLASYIIKKIVSC